MNTVRRKNSLSRRFIFIAALVGAISLLFYTLSSGDSATAESRSGKPTIVLVHGAFADASGWNDVIQRLHRDGYNVIAPANPLRSLHGDSAYLASVLAQTPGPLVVVGHSYGGAVITNATAGNPNVKALVYINAFIPDVGEDTLHLAGEGSQLPNAIEFKGFPPFGETDADIYLKKETFRDVFAADVSPKKAAVMWAGQRPPAALTGAELTTAAGWKSIPSWALIGKQDRTITPEALRFMADRAGATTIEINSSHVAMISHPNQVADLIVKAADATD